MISNKGKEGLALLAVIIVVVAALAAAVVVKDYNNDKDNPNGILGTYVVADYAQYGTQDNWDTFQWYTMGDSSKAFDDQKLTIESYKDGFIKAKSVNGPYSFDMAGYYDPDTGAFGLGAAYSYTPSGGETSNTIDSVRGMIVGDTMYYSGYLSSDNDDVAYVYNFTCVKEGKQASLINYQKVLSPGQFKTNYGYYIDEDGPNPDTSVSFNIAAGDNTFSKGVYVLTVTGDGIDSYGMAATVYQDNDITVLRSISVYEQMQYFGWIVIEDGNMFVYESKVNETYHFCETYVYLSVNESTSSPIQDALDVYVSDMKLFSSQFGRMSDSSDTLVYVQQYGASMIMICYSEPIFINMFPSHSTVVFSLVGEVNGTNYYGDMIGFADGNCINVYGLMFGENNNVIASCGTIKPISA